MQEGGRVCKNRQSEPTNSIFRYNLWLYIQISPPLKSSYIINDNFAFRQQSTALDRIDCGKVIGEILKLDFELKITLLRTSDLMHDTRLDLIGC